MEVQLTEETAAKLARIAEEQGRNVESVAREAVERFVEYDAWFLREVDKGLAQIGRHETLSHEEVGARIETLLAGKRRNS